MARDLTGSEYALTTDDLRASQKGLLYVQVSDGFNTGTAELEGIEAVAAPPVVHIVSPHAKSVAPAGSSITLEAQAYDAEGSIAGERMRWFLDRIEKGVECPDDGVSVEAGEHRVSVEVRATRI